MGEQRVIRQRVIQQRAIRRWLLIGMVLGLAACGAKRNLQSPQGQLPPKPAMAPAARTYEQMAEPPAQAAPDRVNDPLSKSRPRPDDRFDLPPPG